MGLWNGSCKFVFTIINLIFLKKQILSLVLLSDTPQNRIFWTVGNCVARVKILSFASHLRNFGFQGGHFDPWKWSLWPLKVFSLRIQLALKIWKSPSKKAKNKPEMVFFKPKTVGDPGALCWKLLVCSVKMAFLGCKFLILPGKSDRNSQPQIITKI